MRNLAKGTAACWDCKFYVIPAYDIVHICFLTRKEIVTMPMKCKMKEKVK